MSNIHKKIEFRKTLVPYLQELKELTIIDASKEFLISTEETERILNKSLVLKDEPINKVDIGFDEKKVVSQKMQELYVV